MLGFVQSWFAPAADPIGIDFGSDSLRMAQVERQDGQLRLAAAASVDVPSHIRQDPAARFAFFNETVREVLAQNKFRGRRAVLSLPAASMFIQHLRVARMDDAQLKKALVWETQGKLPIDPTQAILRHLVAGEVYQDQEPKNEVILMAAKRDLVQQFLSAAGKARLDVIGMSVEPRAIVDCFAQVHRRKTDSTQTTCYVDIGCNATRAMIASGTDILFARVIPIGGEHFSRAVAAAMKISLAEAKVLRIRLAQTKPAPLEPKPEVVPAAQESEEESFALLSAGIRASEAQAGISAPPDPAIAERRREDFGPRAADSCDGNGREMQAVWDACREPLAKLLEELNLCRRYHESTFPSKPLERLIFIGGEARHRSLCQHIAKEMVLGAQVGDPLARLARNPEIDDECGVDFSAAQPSWAVALGLSMGPAAVAAVANQ